MNLTLIPVETKLETWEAAVVLAVGGADVARWLQQADVERESIRSIARREKRPESSVRLALNRGRTALRRIGLHRRHLQPVQA